jgi:hypothetical protein
MRSKILFVLLCITIFSSIISYSQDKDSLVIISKKLGSIITREKRDYYNIFPIIINYNYSIVYKTAENKFYVKFNIISDGKLSDTIIFYSEQSLYTIAEKINNYDELLEGKYRMGENPTRIIVAGKESTKQQEKEILDKLNKKQFQTPVRKNTQYYTIDNVIIFDTAETSKIIKKVNEKLFGWGFGISSYSADLSGLNSAFTLIENLYRDKGYIIREHSPDFDFGTILWYRIKLGISKQFDLAIDAAKSTSDVNNFYSISANGIWYYLIDNMEWLKSFAEAGVSINYFKSRLKYGDRISEVRNNGTYDFLDYIDASGSKTGFSIKAGCELFMDNLFSINMFMKYLYIPKMATEVTCNLFKVNADARLSSLMFGAMFSIYY